MNFSFRIVKFYLLLDMTSTTGLGCLRGFKWVPEEGKCRGVCEDDTDYEGTDVAGPDGDKSFPGDVEACQKYCSTVAKFITFGKTSGYCHCKTSDEGRRSRDGYVSCPIVP